MRTAELLKLLKKHGIDKVREGKRHEIFYSPLIKKEFPVGRHAKEIPSGTLDSILKDAGLK